MTKALLPTSSGPTRKTTGQQHIAHNTSDVSPAIHLEDGEDSRSTRGESDAVSWDEMQVAFSQDLRPASAQRLAEELGVSVESLKRLGLGFDKTRAAFTFPMYGISPVSPSLVPSRTSSDSSRCVSGDTSKVSPGERRGRIVGIRLRYKDGRKGTLAGGHGGLFIPEGVTPYAVQAICEGPTDTAAALTLGFESIGRPFASDGGSMVVEFMRGAFNACPAIVGDNDAAGRDGAEALAEALRAAETPCQTIFPPDGFKDLRDWLTRSGLTGEDLLRAINAAPVLWPDVKAWPPGYTPIPHALSRRGLIALVGPEAYAVLSVISGFRGAGDVCRVTRKKIAELIGRSIPTVAKCLPVLREKGLLTWRRGGTDRANEYTVHLGPERWQHRKPDGGRKENPKISPDSA
ncbi:MAG TPA: hypothetical protein VNA25_28020 [Phycisphaerae bacterium]|nr:hypothetical protein [Phycisphaerae bacterium]